MILIEILCSIYVYIIPFFSSDSDSEALEVTIENDDLWDDLFINSTDENDTLAENSDDDVNQLEEDDDSSSSSLAEESDTYDLDVYDISDIMKKCRSIIKTIRKSSILHEIIQEGARSLSLKGGLVSDTKIRWNSSAKLIQRLLAHESILKEFYEKLESINGITVQQRQKLIEAELSEADWNILHVLSPILEKFHSATKIIRDATIPIRVNSNSRIGLNWFELELELVGIGRNWNWNWSELVGIGIGIGRNWLELVWNWNWNWSELVGIGRNWSGIGIELALNQSRIG